MIKWKLNDLMAKRNIRTYRELSAISGLSYTLIVSIGQNTLSTMQLCELNTLCRALQCTPADLLDYTKD